MTGDRIIDLMLNLIVGLGNPGDKYKFTRHNLGFRVVEVLARRSHQRFKPGKGNYLFCKVKGGDSRNIFLVKPLTYMNDSGTAVLDAMDHLAQGIENLLVVCDDANLPLGKIRIREKGTDGGHKGLRSIIYLLNSMDFNRLRMGIGDPLPETNLEDFVLQKFEETEKQTVEKMIEKACEATENMLIRGVEDSMSKYND